MSVLLRNISALVLSFCVIAGVQAEEKEVPQNVAGTTKVSAEDVIDLVTNHPDLVIIDARKSSDFQKGYIEGAISLPNTQTTPESLAQHIPGKSTPVLIYCNGIKCGRSVESAEIAVKAGYTDIYWFRGGWGEWIAKGYPITQ
jgi:rhodanese-related sulfurtransferase